MFAPKCGGCARAILENYISALNTLWHPECFVCRVRAPSLPLEARGRAAVGEAAASPCFLSPTYRARSIRWEGRRRTPSGAARPGRGLCRGCETGEQGRPAQPPGSGRVQEKAGWG